MTPSLFYNRAELGYSPQGTGGVSFWGHDQWATNHPGLLETGFWH